jgi:chemotaxis protein CheZ
MDEAPNTPLPGGYDQGMCTTSWAAHPPVARLAARAGLCRPLQGAVDALPDAQSRLTYIARLTGEAAKRCWALWTRPRTNTPDRGADAENA